MMFGGTGDDFVEIVLGSSSPPWCATATGVRFLAGTDDWPPVIATWHPQARRQSTEMYDRVIAAARDLG